MNDFDVTQNGTETHFSPTRKRILRTLAVFLFGAAVMLVGGFVLYRTHDDVNAQHRMIWPFGGIVASILMGLTAVWMWRIRSTSLIVDAKSGEVRYGNRLICEAGTVTAVRLACSHLEADENACSFDFIIGEGKVMQVPSPWFAAMSATAASEIARSIAALLKVEVQSEGVITRHSH